MVEMLDESIYVLTVSNFRLVLGHKDKEMKKMIKEKEKGKWKVKGKRKGEREKGRERVFV